MYPRGTYNYPFRGSTFTYRRKILDFNGVSSLSRKSTLNRYKYQKSTASGASSGRDSSSKSLSSSLSHRASSTSKANGSKFVPSMLTRISFNTFKPPSSSSKYKFIKNPRKSSPKEKIDDFSAGGAVSSRYVYRRKSLTSSRLNAYRSTVKKAINTKLRFVKRHCQDYIQTGFCETGENCPCEHDPNRLRICPKFLQNSCLKGKDRCPLAHVYDPCRIPLCGFYVRGTCLRSDCPFLHADYPPNTPRCPNFKNGRCTKGRECQKRHVWPPVKKPESSKVPSDLVNSKAIEAEKPRLKPLEGSLRDLQTLPDFIPFVLREEFSAKSDDQTNEGV